MTPDSLTAHLFVYGTLREAAEHPMAEVLGRHAARLGNATVRARLYDLGAYPGAVLDQSCETVVQGELFALHEGAVQLLRQLDAYEGCSPPSPEPPLFRRELTRARLADGREVEAWIYTYARATAGAPLIRSGDYLTRG